MSEANTVEELERTAREAARSAGAVLLRRFRTGGGLAVDRKSLHDFVTVADRESETVIVDRIREEHPGHGILAEERPPAGEGARFRWIVDPLDGTTNFIHGVATFSVSIAVEDRDTLLAGAIYDPVHDEMFHAGRGRGARLNDRPIACSAPEGLDECVVATGFPFRSFEKLEGYLAALRHLMTRTSGIRRAGSAALDLAYTACGRYDGFWETGLSPWDLAAGALIVSEAGGTVSDFSGGARFVEAGEIVAAGTGIHPALLEVTRRHLA